MDFLNPLKFKFGDGQFMFVLKKQIDSGIFNLLFMKVKYIFEFRFNSVNQCTKLISHSVTNVEPK